MSDLEARVLYGIVQCRCDAYGVSISDEIEKRSGREIAMGAIYATLDRLEKKGYVRSWWSEPVAERGGRRKRLFEISGSGEQALVEHDESHRRMSEGWRSIMPGAIENV